MTNPSKATLKHENPRPAPPPGGKLGQIIRLLQRNRGATIEDMVTATGWQPHSVRGAISGPLKKRYRLAITASTNEARGRVYRLAKTIRAGGSR